ncbi:unnamed protein product [Symbiodinium sp. CCMP2592]|nr:unnamed protein product [Symbiodinium sp. CCMP2592]
MACCGFVGVFKLGNRPHFGDDYAGRDGSESFSSASQLLRHYEVSAANGSLREHLDLLRQVGHLSPSIHDDRLQKLAHEVIARRDELSLTALVEASQALQTLGLRQELGPLVSMVTESASFLSSDVILSFARSLLCVPWHLGSVIRDLFAYGTFLAIGRALIV